MSYLRIADGRGADSSSATATPPPGRRARLSRRRFRCNGQNGSATSLQRGGGTKARVRLVPARPHQSDRDQQHRVRPPRQPPGLRHDRASRSSSARERCDTVLMDAGIRLPLRRRVAEHIRAHGLIAPGGEVVALVSGGADSTCLWHALARARLPRLGAARQPRPARRRVGRGRAFLPGGAGRGGRRGAGAGAADRGGAARAPLLRSPPTGCARPGHTASDQVETVLYRLVASGNAKGIKPKREDGVVRPLLTLWREETEAYCRAEGLEFRTDSSNADTRRGLIRDELLPLLRRLHPGAEQNLLRPRRAAAVEARPAARLGRGLGSRSTSARA